MTTLNKRTIIVNISDAKVSNNQLDILKTYSLGSCIGVCLYDTKIGIGGLLHYQLPQSSLNPDRAKENPFMFADTGIKAVINKMYSLGSRKEYLNVTIAGGASITIAPKGFDIGKRNHLAIRKIMWKLGIPIKNEDVGGTHPRNVYLDIASGQVTIKTCQTTCC